jgi:hypothetical protein
LEENKLFRKKGLHAIIFVETISLSAIVSKRDSVGKAGGWHKFKIILSELNSVSNRV